jgi:hypothetical protein
MAAMNMVSAGGFPGVSFHLKRCPHGVASVLCKKTPIFGYRRSKLDHLAVADTLNVLRHERDLVTVACLRENADNSQLTTGIVGNATAGEKRRRKLGTLGRVSSRGMCVSPRHARITC